jgi:hypothetical protein
MEFVCFCFCIRISERRTSHEGHVKGNAYRILVGRPEGKRPLGRPRCRWVDNNIKMNLREIVGLD